MAKFVHTKELDESDFKHSWVEVQFSQPIPLYSHGGSHRLAESIKLEPGSQAATNCPPPIDPRVVFVCLALAAIFSWMTVQLGCGDMVVFMLGILALTAAFEYLFERVKRMTKK